MSVKQSLYEEWLHQPNEVSNYKHNHNVFPLSYSHSEHTATINSKLILQIYVALNTLVSDNPFC